MSTKVQTLSNYWWVLTIKGTVAILFGIAAVFWPGITLVTLLYLFSAYVLIGGVTNIFHGISGMGNRGTWIFTLLLGFLELGVGVYLLRHPGVTFTTLILLIGFLLITRGVFEVVAAFGDEISSGTRLLSIIGGALAVLAGIFVLFQPESSGVAFVWILGLYALITGPLLIALSLEIKNIDI